MGSPPLQGRGRGWGLSTGRLAQLAAFAREMRREPTEPEKRLWSKLSRSQLGGYKFRRQTVIGPFIADFLCPQKALIVEVDGDTHSVESNKARDEALNAMGYSIIRIANHDVRQNIEGVCAAILGALQQAPDRWASPHPNPSPEGEGLSHSQGQEF
ncbi:endonuclease domain-containing protein [Sphingobium sp. SJ10-10]|uniref:endonuclease domain-containing protein n=1 Tax=Sphingobium sp. SJ10-10 TaxID=3114999 RepID=UPI002E19C5AF|nr:endonuclease domain-containing protein [Sphingobium sp. SJ10-10]